MQKEKIEVAGATVEFYSYKDGDIEVYEFNTSKCGPPEPMVNAMAGLKLIDGPNKKLVMINHKKPMGLLDKVGQNYDINDRALDDGTVALEFTYKNGESEKANLNDASCGG
jgi:hypothetical protein